MRSNICCKRFVWVRMSSFSLHEQVQRCCVFTVCEIDVELPVQRKLKSSVADAYNNQLFRIIIIIIAHNWLTRCSRQIAFCNCKRMYAQNVYAIKQRMETKASGVFLAMNPTSFCTVHIRVVDRIELDTYVCME